MNIIQNETENTAQNATESAIQTIQASWNKTAKSILDTAKLLVDHANRNDWQEIRFQLFHRDIMQKSVISMMLSIGKNTTLNDPKYLEQLPRSYNSLYHLSTMDEDKLESVFDDGVINSSTILNDVRDLVKAHNNKQPKEVAESMVIGLSMKPEDYDANKKELDMLIADIISKHPFITCKNQHRNNQKKGV